MKTYIKENERTLQKMILFLLDKEYEMEWKVNVFNPYIDFLYKLEFIKKYGWIDNKSDLKSQSDFIDKLIDLCEKYKDLGEDMKGIINSAKFRDWFLEMMGEWIEKHLNYELAVVEKEFYSRIAWQDEPLENDEKRQTPLQKKKNEAMVALNKYKTTNLG